MRNRDWINGQNLYDLLIKMQEECTFYKARCVLEMLTGGTQSTTNCLKTEEDWKKHSTKPCEQCIQAWLNAERR